MPASATLEQLAPISVRDTHVGSRELPLAEGLAQLKEIRLAFASSKLVVTDRLHGMIFCAITGTPSLAIDRNNAQVSRFNRAWLQDIGHVRLLSRSDPVEVCESAASLMSVTPNLETTRSLRSVVIDRPKSVVETPPHRMHAIRTPTSRLRGHGRHRVLDLVMISVNRAWPAECGVPHGRELLVPYSKPSSPAPGSVLSGSTYGAP
jgi:hypothetical protein